MLKFYTINSQWNFLKMLKKHYIRFLYTLIIIVILIENKNVLTESIYTKRLSLFLHQIVVNKGIQKIYLKNKINTVKLTKTKKINIDILFYSYLEFFNSKLIWILTKTYLVNLQNSISYYECVATLLKFIRVNF